MVLPAPVRLVVSSRFSFAFAPSLLSALVTRVRFPALSFPGCWGPPCCLFTHVVPLPGVSSTARRAGGRFLLCPGQICSSFYLAPTSSQSGVFQNSRIVSSWRGGFFFLTARPWPAVRRLAPGLGGRCLLAGMVLARPHDRPADCVCGLSYLFSLTVAIFRSTAKSTAFKTSRFRHR